MIVTDILFMGTPDYSVETLKALIKAGHNVKAVFAQPDKPVGRKQVLTAPPTKVFAQENGIPVFQPSTLRDGTALEIISKINPDVIVVVAYGKILPAEILAFPKYGCVNAHASLLPKLRGASPIQWAIVSGEKTTGVSSMFMDEGMDTGDVLLTQETQIGENETAEELFERLSVMSAAVTVKTLEELANGTVVRKKQNENDATYAPIIKKEMAKIDFSRSALQVHNLIRGFYSWPCAFFMLDGKRVKVLESRIGEKTDKKFGTVVCNSGMLSVACGDGVAVNLVTVQPEGSKAMSSTQMLCGKKIPLGTAVGE